MRNTHIEETPKWEALTSYKLTNPLQVLLHLGNSANPPLFYSQHLQKLKRKDGAAGSGSGDATPKNSRATPKKRGKAADEEPDTNTPKTKKCRTSVAKKVSVSEDQDDEEEKASFFKNESE